MAPDHFSMFLPIGWCNGSFDRSADTSTDGRSGWRRHQERKLRMLTFWRDGIERQLAAMNAAIRTLETQMQRDQAEPQAGSQS
jgi:hypothetical protein